MIEQYELRSNEIVEISADALSTFQKYRPSLGTNEAGGILLGRVYPGSRIVVEVATPPNTHDKAGRFYFHRDAVTAQQIVNRAWHNGQGECIYLGEWHSHNEPYPCPSRRDRQMIRKMLRKTRMEINFLLLIIVGIKECWVGVEDGKVLTELRTTVKS
ncbi:MAG: Mov34/MPN/PAD-1 family protein [Anaerolineae bacterium]|nr:Mov34/MPN/PAD-1 family protein [Anaerolineae bacterium]